MPYYNHKELRKLKNRFWSYKFTLKSLFKFKKYKIIKLKKYVKKLKSYKKINENIVKFDDIEIEECEFCQHKNPILINDIDVNKIVVSNKLPFVKKDFKYFIALKMLKN